MQTIQTTLQSAVEQLTESGVETPHLDARILLCNVLGVTIEHIIGYPEEAVDEAAVGDFLAFVARRGHKEPVAKIIGKKEFWGREFIVNQHVLDPRPDSETLIEAVFNHFKDTSKPYRIIDIGTGSGCLLLSLLCEYRNATGVAVDLSEDALGVARANAEKLGVARRVEFMQSNWLENVDGEFDITVSNPPYIETVDIENLEDDVKGFDPLSALDGGQDGLDCYRTLVPQVQSGTIFLEIGEGQLNSVSEILEKNKFVVLQSCEDLAGVARCIVARKII